MAIWTSIFTALGNFLWARQDTIVALLPVLFALFRASKWGLANQQALTQVAQVVEARGQKDLKTSIAAKLSTASEGAQMAIAQAVAVADPKKTPLSVYEQISDDLALALYMKPRSLPVSVPPSPGAKPQ